MKCLCFDPISGASGDMILGALFDLGADLKAVQDVLASAGLETVRLTFDRVGGEGSIQHGRCIVSAPEEHVHRNLEDMLALVHKSDAPSRAKNRAQAIFERLAEAEAAVHGVAVDHVHFHEVGGLDTIADVLGSCMALESLDVERVYCAPFKTGRGTVTCAHGVLPVPTPATVQLLRGHPVQRLDVEAELTTPTGAAILTTLTQGDWAGLTTTLLQTGTGAGSRKLPGIPNILRAFLVEQAPTHEYVEVLETDLDDQTPEVTAAVTQMLRKQGALDVTLTPIYMKKGRPGVRLSILARAGESHALAATVFQHTSTIGLRVTSARRWILPRRMTTMQTPWGTVAAKAVERPQGTEVVPEADACRELAQRAGVSMREVMDAAHEWIDSTTAGPPTER